MNSSSSWTTGALNRLALGPCGYQSGSPPAAEPTAFAALALLGAGRGCEAQAHLQWLADRQQADGSIASLGILKQPGWPTPLALIASAVACRQLHPPNHSPLNLQIRRAQQWLVSTSGVTSQGAPEFGHDGRLRGWPWVVGTHSWQEPTAWAVLALKAVGLAKHLRTRDGVLMLVDRLLATGGCNYGNTVVLGQRLRPHIEPTGVTMLALAGESIDDPRIERSLQYLTATLTRETTPISLSYGLLGLTANHRSLASEEEWLAAAYHRSIQHGASPPTLALLVLAAQGAECPLIKISEVQELQPLGNVNERDG